MNGLPEYRRHMVMELPRSDQWPRSSISSTNSRAIRTAKSGASMESLKWYPPSLMCPKRVLSPNCNLRVIDPKRTESLAAQGILVCSPDVI